MIFLILESEYIVSVQGERVDYRETRDEKWRCGNEWWDSDAARRSSTTTRERRAIVVVGCKSQQSIRRGLL